MLNKKQQDAIAWVIFAGGGTFDTSDVVAVLESCHAEIETDEERELIADMVADIHTAIEEKANRKYDRAFKKPTD